MSKKTKTANLTLIVSSSVGGLINATDSRAVCAALEKCGELAYQARDREALLKIGYRLSDSRFRYAQGVGNYLTALGLVRSGQEHFDEVERLLERAIDLCPALTARAILSLAAVETYRNGFPTCGEELIREAVRHRDLYAAIEAQRLIIWHQGEQGDHQSAVRLLRELGRSLRGAVNDFPILPYFIQNSLACELLATGELEEAAYRSAVALSCPMADAYPEWRETAEEISQAIAAQGRRAIIRIPAPDRSECDIESAPPKTSREPARVIKFPERPSSVVDEFDCRDEVIAIACDINTPQSVIDEMRRIGRAGRRSAGLPVKGGTL